MEEILPGVFHWSTYHPGIETEVSSYWIDAAGVLVDPLIPAEVGLEWFAGRPAPPQTIVLCNRHHYRDSTGFVERFGTTVHAPRAGMYEFTHGEPVVPFDPGDAFAGDLTVHEVGCICADDTALHLPKSRAIVLADGVIRGGSDLDARPIGFVPDEYMDDPAETKRGLLEAFTRLLGELEFEHVLLTHGGPIIGTGRAELQELVECGGRTAFQL